ncbi:MAG TPA: hypothetical protein VM118_13825, partial [Acidobacteriota bacterium]|nr:hypothetical protein [Acidobacteriota bacterium]
MARRLLAILAALLTFGFDVSGQFVVSGQFTVADGGASPITASAVAECVQGSSGTLCLAPAVVHVDATATTHSGSYTSLFRTLKYEWSFDDPGQGDWLYGAAALDAGWDKNYETGGVGVHVYDAAGTYQIDLKVTDPAGATDTDFTSITIVDPDTYYGSGQTYCFANITGTGGLGGDYTGCPDQADSPVETDTDDFDTAMTTCSSGSNVKTRCLFRRGDTFLQSATVTLDATGTNARQLGSFGTGARPIFNIGATDTKGFSGGDRWTVFGVNFARDNNTCSDKMTNECDLVGINGVSNFTLYDSASSGWFRTAGSDGSEDLVAFVEYESVTDSHLDDQPGINKAPNSLMASKRSIYVGSKLDKNYMGEYIIRAGTSSSESPGGDKDVFSHNYMLHTNTDGGTGGDPDR